MGDLSVVELLVDLSAAVELAAIAAQDSRVSSSTEVVCAACHTWATGGRTKCPMTGTLTSDLLAAAGREVVVTTLSCAGQASCTSIVVAGIHSAWSVMTAQRCI